MPSAHELIAHGRTTEEVAELIGADWLVYQDLQDLEDAVSEGNANVKGFDSSVFTGEYITGDVNESYLNRIEQARNDSSKVSAQAVSAIIDLYNN
jgi:amidophosphoribosyltransferase